MYQSIVIPSPIICHSCQTIFRRIEASSPGWNRGCWRRLVKTSHDPQGSYSSLFLQAAQARNQLGGEGIIWTADNRCTCHFVSYPCSQMRYSMSSYIIHLWKRKRHFRKSQLLNLRISFRWMQLRIWGGMLVDPTAEEDLEFRQEQAGRDGIIHQIQKRKVV